MKHFWRFYSAFMMAIMLTAGIAAPAKCDDEIVLVVPATEEPGDYLQEDDLLADMEAAEFVGAGQYVRGYVDGCARYDIAAEYLDKINDYRISCGAGRVQIDRELSDYAMQRAAEQLCRYGHTRPDGSGCFDSPIFSGTWSGETALYGGRNITADTIFNSFHSSHAHDSIVKDNVYKYVGIGVVESKDGFIWVVCNYCSIGSPANIKTEKEQKKWSFNVCPEFFSPMVTPDKISTEGGRKLLTVKGNHSNLLLKGTYTVSSGISSIRSDNNSIAEVENGVIIPRSAGTANLTIKAMGKEYKVQVMVDGATVPTSTPAPVPTEEPTETSKSYEGTYIIRSAKNHNYAVDVAGASKTKGANIQLYKVNGTEAQVFIIKAAGNGYYTIANRRSGMLLDVAGASKKSGTNIHQYTANGTDAQLWRIAENSDGSVTFVSKLGTVLDVSGGLMQNGRNIQAYSPNGTIAQKWVLDKIRTENVP